MCFFKALIVRRLPSFAVVTTGKAHDLRVARQLEFEPGTVLVFDRGYIDLPVVCRTQPPQGVLCDAAERERGV